MLSILAVGEDKRLLSSRVDLLRGTKVPVVETTSSTALALFHRCRFDVVVLCHTLSLADSYILIKAARRHKAVGVLQVLAAALARPVFDAIGVDTVIQGDNLVLLNRVGEMLRLSGAGSSFIGKAKEGLGRVLGDDDLAGEGAIDQASGAVKDTAGKLAHAIGETIHDLNR